MPSRKNRSLKKNKRRNTTCKIHQNYDYNEEDIVWAKLAGYPIWPGKVFFKSTSFETLTSNVIR